MFRQASEDDIVSVAGIYEEIFEQEKQGLAHIGWIPGVYPTRDTAHTALTRGELYVYEENGTVLASAIINQSQVDAYKEGNWQYPAPTEQVMVLHTLTVSPAAGKRGIGKRFVAFYENQAASRSCPYLRMDTNAINTRARALYKSLGYREIGIVPCTFNGIPDVRLVLLEKKL